MTTTITQTHEYRVINQDHESNLEELLNAAASEGFHVVAVIPAQPRGGTQQVGLNWFAPKPQVIMERPVAAPSVPGSLHTF